MKRPHLKVAPMPRHECPGCHKIFQLTRAGHFPHHGTIDGICSGTGKKPGACGEIDPEKLANLESRHITRKGTTPMTIITMVITGIPTSVDGEVKLIDAEVTVDFALVAADCLSGASFGKLKRKATRMGGAIAAKVINVRRKSI